MATQLKAMAFDVDSESLFRLRQALPEWRIDIMSGASAAAFPPDCNPAAASLLVVGACEPLAQTLALCRALRRHTNNPRVPLLVLVPPSAEALVRAVLDAGANSCLVMPIHAKELVSMVSRAKEGNRPGHHTLSLDRAQRKDQWRDDGGEA